MIRGLYTSGTGMKAQMRRMDVVSNNLANVDTAGYKKDEAVLSSFPDILMTRINDTRNNIKTPTPMGNVNLGTKIDEIYTNFSQGSFIRTDEKFNVALQGDGYFTISTPEGERFTRDGGFVLGPDGRLMTSEGNYVMGQAGIITLGNEFLAEGGEVFIDDNGRIMVGNNHVDTLRIVAFEDNSQLQKIGDNLYQSNANTIPFNGQVVQGFIESSNVNPVEAMVDLITVSRAYEANQKIIQVHDALMGKAVNEVGKV
ncbi:MAG: flagellar hook-basal body protein [Epulopiscium sp.]|nr:flagellar hook-basal body protein [Candidatus Epulonipiscium sp.]